MSPRSRGRGARTRGGEVGRSLRVRHESETIYLVAEGEGTEYDYFGHINRLYKADQGPWLRFPHEATRRNGLTPAAVVAEASRQVGASTWTRCGHCSITTRAATSIRCADGLGRIGSRWLSPIRPSSSGYCCTSSTSRRRPTAAATPRSCGGCAGLIRCSPTTGTATSGSTSPGSRRCGRTTVSARRCDAPARSPPSVRIRGAPVPTAGRLGVPHRGAMVRDLDRKWGVRRPGGEIVLHWALFQMPARLADLVAVHELAHIAEPRHGPEFLRLVAQAIPDHRERSEDLAHAGRAVWLGAIS